MKKMNENKTIKTEKETIFLKKKLLNVYYRKSLEIAITHMSTTIIFNFIVNIRSILLDRCPYTDHIPTW